MPSHISRAFRLAAFAGLACATYISLRLAWADHLFHSGTAAGAAHALALGPDNAAYALRAGQPERAAALQPRLAEAWIELGLAAERSGQWEQGARYLERAAAVDATYAPVWTLANFYARRGDGTRFLAAAKRALQVGDMGHYDPVPLFRLAWNMSPEHAAILEQATRPAAERVLAHPPSRDWLPLLAYCDRLIAAGDADQAVYIWNAFIARTEPGRPLLTPADQTAVNNGEFAWEPVEHGFDWRIPTVAGVTCVRAGPPGGMRIVFDGREAERCQVLEQLVPVIAQTHYRLQIRYRTEAIQPGAGPRWHILDAVTRHEISSDATVRFLTPAGVRLAVLALVYERVPGTARIAGTLQIEHVTLDLNP
jgi:tetratricopeptide (TPR) repeat protein